MARPLRIEFEDAIHHVCARGNARQAIFFGESDRAGLVDLFHQSARRFDVGIIAFVLLGNHFHLIAQTRRANLSRWMHWLLTSYTVSFNKRHRRSGHLFQGRYKSFVVEEGDYLLSLSRYIHLNPVRGVQLGKGDPSQRRQRLRAFKWSTYRGYAGLARPFDFVESDMVFAELGGPIRSARVRYRRFVEEGLVREIENPLAAIRWQTVLGRENFVRAMRDHVRALSGKHREVPALRGLTRPALRAHEILAKMADRHKITKETLLRGRHGMVERNLAMWLIWENGDKSLREIGEMFGGLDYAAVSDRIRRVRATYNPKQIRHLLAEILNLET